MAHQERPRQSGLLTALLLALVAGLLLRLEAARSPVIVHPDEIFQMLEPAHRLAYGYGVITWEWRSGIRSWVFPALLAGLMRATDWTGANPTAYLWGSTVILSLISLVAVWFGFVCGRRLGGREAAIVAAAACAVWYELVIFGPRTLTEVVAGHVLLPGLYLGVYSNRFEERTRMFVAGLLCGIAVALRPQLAPAALFAGIYFCRRNWRRRWSAVTTGVLLPILAFGFVDALTWSYPFQSFFLYFWANVVQGRSRLYGTEPWYWYVVVMAQHLGLTAVFGVMGARRSPFLAGVVVVILVVHSLIPHKEVRFLFPMMPLVITLAALGLVDGVRSLSVTRGVPPSPIAVVVFCVAFFVLNSAFLAPQFSYWSERSGTLIAFEQLSRDPRVCGVGLRGTPWFEGGYAHLHRDVPIVFVPDDPSVEGTASSFNALLSSGQHPQDGFQLAGCWNGVCLYRREGPCDQPSLDAEINTVLRLTGN